MFLLLVTLTSMLLAAVMSIAAWRIAVQERLRSEARVDALAAEIHGAPAPGSQPITYRQDGDLELRPAVSGSELFGAVRPAAASPRFAAVMGIGVLVVVTAVTAALALSTVSRRASAHEATSVATPAPLELVSLEHERDGDSLTIRGVVRNPRSGARLDDLTAVVFLFTGDGGFVASGRATVTSVSLGPGGESTFVVTVPNAADTGRFRVSFRTDDHAVAHVDKRHER